MEYQPSLFGYPKSPGWKARDTARLSAKQSEPKAPRLRQACLDQLLLRGPMTTDECAEAMGADRLSIRPRFSELARMGKIADTGERRFNESRKRAIVWRAIAGRPE